MNQVRSFEIIQGHLFKLSDDTLRFFSAPSDTGYRCPATTNRSHRLTVVSGAETADSDGQQLVWQGTISGTEQGAAVDFLPPTSATCPQEGVPAGGCAQLHLQSSAFRLTSVIPTSGQSV